MRPGYIESFNIESTTRVVFCTPLSLSQGEFDSMTWLRSRQWNTNVCIADINLATWLTGLGRRRLFGSLDFLDVFLPATPDDHPLPADHRGQMT
jgi:hypothetical protein